MITLNNDQKEGREFVKQWWLGTDRCMVIEGRAGVGKTAMTLEVLSSLYGCDPVITAPTNEAARQLQKVVGLTYPVKTTYSLLGFSFDTRKEKPELVHRGLPQELDHYNLIVVDEASMVGELLFKALMSAEKKILFLGHRSQLPEVNVSLKDTDLCESLIFSKEYKTYTLTQPIRNKGDLFKYCNHLDNLIYTDKPRIVKAGYGISQEAFCEYVNEKAKSDIFSGESVIIGWSNIMVDAINHSVRKVIFEKDIVDSFYTGDKIILTAPSLYVGKADNRTFKQLVKLRKKSVRLVSNYKTAVLSIRTCDVLHIPCWALSCLVEGTKIELFIAKDASLLENLKKMLLLKAYTIQDDKARHKSFETLHYIMMLFSQVKHSYCITVHRSQGMSVNTSIVLYNNIRKCPNVYLKHKLLYVAASRARNNLMIVR